MDGNQRNIFGLYQKHKDSKLTFNEIQDIKSQIMLIEADMNRFAFNDGRGIGFDDDTGIISINKAVFKEQSEVLPEYRLSIRGILAHEYWGHLMNHPSPHEPNTPEDECWADDSAARRSPGLTAEDKTILFRRALKYAQIAREQFPLGESAFEYKVDDLVRRYLSDDEICKLSE